MLTSGSDIPIQLSRLRTDLRASDEQARALQRQFHDRHHVLLKGLLSPDLLAILLPQIEAGLFADAAYEDVGSDLRMAANSALEGLHLAANDPLFLQTIETMTDTRPLRLFGGRIYRMLPGAGHGADWHNDLFGDRQIGMSINLSREPYDGGRFQLRQVGEPALIGDVHNIGLGDAILFRLATSLEHRVTSVTGDRPKTALAGWFRPGSTV
jgi:hypothetical protein